MCGGIVGIERQLRGKAIGIRTSILICLATQVFIRPSIHLTVVGAIVDPTRVLGQVVTGVGFLGAGRPVEALVLATLVVGVLIVVRTLESAFKRLSRGSDEPDGKQSDQGPVPKPLTE